MEYPIGQLLMSNNSIYRVISVTDDSLVTLEYTLRGCDNEPKYLSKYKDVWYQWKNGSGEKVTLSKLGITSPLKIPQMLKNFSQLDNERSLIIKKTAYLVVEQNSLTPPEKWEGRRIICLSAGKKEALLSLESLKQQSLFEKAANCEFFFEGNISRLNEDDIWTIPEV